MKPKESPQEQLKEYGRQIIDELRRWEDQYKNGCNDPFWSDGCNLNLIRNHIFYYKNKMIEICSKNNIDLPEEYYLPAPPYTDMNYFAKSKSERAKRILKYHLCVNNKKVKKKHFNSSQLTLFDM